MMGKIEDQEQLCYEVRLDAHVPADPVGPTLGPTGLPRSRACAVSWSARAWSATF